MFNRAKKGLQGISVQAKHGTDQEKRVAKNVTSSLALSLQDLSINFRKSQSTFLKSQNIHSLLFHHIHSHNHSLSYFLLLVLLFFLPELKNREERVVGGEVKPSATPFLIEEEEEEPEVLYDKV